MKRISALLVALTGVLALSAPMLASQVGETTINLRAWVGTSELNGVTVCLRQSGQQETCAQTEDGEFWMDSLPHGAYRARVETPVGYELTGITCTSFPDLSYSPCNVQGNQVRFVVRKGVVAVNVNFLFGTP